MAERPSELEGGAGGEAGDGDAAGGGGSVQGAGRVPERARVDDQDRAVLVQADARVAELGEAHHATIHPQILAPPPPPRGRGGGVGCYKCGAGTETITTCTRDGADGRLVPSRGLVAVWRPEPLPGHPGVQYFTGVTRIYTANRPPLYGCQGKQTCYPVTSTFGLWGRVLNG